MKWLVEGLIYGEKKSYSRAELTMPSSWDTAENRDVQVEKLWRMLREWKKYLKRGWVDKRGRKQSYIFQSVTSIEFGRKTGRIHPHLLIDRRIPREVMVRAAVRTGFGRRLRVKKIDDSSVEAYKRDIKYAVKYISKGGWNVTMGKRRFSVSPEYAKSIRRYREENQKPFEGIITDEKGLIAIGEEYYVREPFMDQGAVHDKGDLGREAVKNGMMDAETVKSMGDAVRKRGAYRSQDIRRPTCMRGEPRGPSLEPKTVEETPPLNHLWGQRVGYYLLENGKMVWVDKGTGTGG